MLFELLGLWRHMSQYYLNNKQNVISDTFFVKLLDLKRGVSVESKMYTTTLCCIVGTISSPRLSLWGNLCVQKDEKRFRFIPEV